MSKCQYQYQFQEKKYNWIFYKNILLEKLVEETKEKITAAGKYVLSDNENN